VPFTPKEILDSIPETKRLVRLHALVRIYNDVCAPRWQNTLLDKDILLHCVESYVCDLERTKAFHDILLADQHKQAAFTIKWLAKTRPIIVRPGAPQTKASLLANEVFALTAGLNWLKASPSDLSDSLLRNLLYTLHYRSLDAEVLATLMYAIECGLVGKKP
jgi:hypothetical protein